MRASPLIWTASLFALLAAPLRADQPPATTLPPAMTQPPATTQQPTTTDQPASPPGSLTWTTYKADLQRTGSSQAHVQLPLNLVWRHSTEAQPGVNLCSPLVLGPPSQRRIYFSSGRHVFCVDSTTGALLWRSHLLHGGVTAPISLMTGDSGDLVLAVSSDGFLAALHTADGDQAWEVDCQAPVPSAGPVYIHTDRGDRIVLGLSTGRLVAVTPQGQLDATWNVGLGREFAAPTSTPILSSDGTRLWVTAQDGRIYVVSTAKGTLEYSIALSNASFSTPALIGDMLVVAAGTNVTGYGAHLGNQRWNVTIGSMVSAVSAHVNALGNAVAFAGARNGKFVAIDVARGRLLWQSDLEASVSGVPVVLPNVVLVGTRIGTLVGLDPASGKTLWQFRLDTARTPGPPEGSEEGAEDNAGGEAQGGDSTVYGLSACPSVVDGQVYVLADNAALYSFSDQDFDTEPPRAVQPSLTVPGDNGRLVPQLINPDAPLVVPGRAPIYFAVELADNGSGVDPDSIQATFDGQPVDPKNVLFEASSGNLTITLIDRTQGAGIVQTLGDGIHSLRVIVKDYRGNQLTYTASFNVDASVAAPQGGEDNQNGNGQG